MIAIKEDNLLRNELITLKVIITRSSNPLQEGIKGVVVDETKRMLVVADASKKRYISKECVIYGFTMPDGTFIEVDGKRLLGRPADRIKKKFRRKQP